MSNLNLNVVSKGRETFERVYSAKVEGYQPPAIPRDIDDFEYRDIFMANYHNFLREEDRRMRLEAFDSMVQTIASALGIKSAGNREMVEIQRHVGATGVKYVPPEVEEFYVGETKVTRVVTTPTAYAEPIE